jgi:ketosteroid isomerase-like protein
VAEDVDWTVEGTHPLAGRYRSKSAFVDSTFKRINGALTEPAKLEVGKVLVDGDWAAVELSMRARAKSGLAFDNDYCWLVRFSGETIVEVRAYLDSALVARLIDENDA